MSDRAKTCPSCGIDIAGKITRCPDCGEIIFKDQATCPNCNCTINGGAAYVAPSESVATTVRQEPVKPIPVAPPRKPKKKKKTGAIVFVTAVVIALIVFFVGFYFYKTQEEQNEMRAYENAYVSDQPAVLQNYLDMYAQAPKAHRDSINAHLTALKQIDIDWANALVSGSKAELEKYMKRHPNSVHNVEAKLQIDSLDWVAACQTDTPESYQAYISAHYDGAHYDEAMQAYEHLEAQQVRDTDKQMVSELFANYYRALSNRDESMLTATLANVLTSFLHKEQATKTDVMQYMHKLYEEDVEKIVFTLNNDWKIDKKSEGDGQFSYSVDFSVDQKIERDDESKERFCTYKVQAKVSPDCKISELNMRKIVQ